MVQVGCYEDSKLLKLFTDIIRILYDNDIVAEDTIMWWAKKGAHPKVHPTISIPTLCMHNISFGRNDA